MRDICTQILDYFPFKVHALSLLLPGCQCYVPSRIIFYTLSERGEAALKGFHTRQSCPAAQQSVISEEAQTGDVHNTSQHSNAVNS
jgi:hypothetical protein